jgi:hypothetical protein
MSSLSTVFLILSQNFDCLLRYGAAARFDTIPQTQFAGAFEQITRANGEEVIVIAMLAVVVIEAVVKGFQASTCFEGEFRLDAEASHPAGLVIPTIAEASSLSSAPFAALPAVAAAAAAATAVPAVATAAAIAAASAHQ